MTGSPPESLALDLPRGRHHAPVRPEQLADLELPAQLADGSGGVALGAIGVRSTALSTGVSIAARRAHARLRLDSGLTYNAWAAYQPLTSDLAHFTLGGDCLDEHAIAVRDGTLAVMHELGELGATEDELDEARGEQTRAMQDPNARRVYVDYAAREALLGSEALSPEEFLAELEKLQGGDVAAAIAAHLEELILLAPTRTPTPPGFRDYGSRSHERLAGRTYSAGHWWRRRETIVSADEGVTLLPTDQESPVTIRFEDCMAVLRWSPTRVTMLGLDGSWIELQTRNLVGGESLIRSVLERVPPERVVSMEDVVTYESLLELAHSKLGRTDVGNQFQMLPEHLLPGERVENLAWVATSPIERGVLALTDQRLVYVSARRYFRRTKRVRAFAYSEISAVRGRYARAAKLLQLVSIVVGGETVRFWEFRPRQRAPEFWRALQERTSTS